MADRKRTPINTLGKMGGVEVLMDTLVRGSYEGAIEAQEARGQQSFVESDTLPTDMGIFNDYNAKAILEVAGVKFFGGVDNDELFQYVKLPEGWKKEPTDHPMWSKLMDDKGRERARIFYKAASYDRTANMSLSCRFKTSFDYDRYGRENVAVVHVMDCDKMIHSTEPIKLPINIDKKPKYTQKAKKAAVRWLDKHYPDWQNPGAYWD